MKWKVKRDPLDRVMDKVERTTGCWIFTGALRNGYGAVGIEGKTVYAHRYVYEWLVAPIPPRMVIDHLCRNRACVNPDHLEVVTQRENVMRGERAGIRVMACKRGHDYTPENTYVDRQGYRSCITCRRERGRAVA